MSATLTPRLLLGAPTAWTSFLPYLVQLGPTYCCLLSRTVLSIHYSLTMHVRVASAGRLGLTLTLTLTLTITLTLIRLVAKQAPTLIHRPTATNSSIP